MRQKAKKLLVIALMKTESKKRRQRSQERVLYQFSEVKLATNIITYMRSVKKNRTFSASTKI